MENDKNRTRDRQSGKKNMLNKKMTRNSIGIAFLLMIVCGFGAANAQSISVSGSPGPFIISSATAGSDLAPVSNATTTYNVRTTSGTSKITGRINSLMPADATLKVMLAAPGRATSAGAVILTTTNKNLVTGIPYNTNANDFQIFYEFRATVGCGVIPSASKTVTFTLTAD